MQAFVPDPLPPRPPLELDAESRERIDQAHLALGRLDAVSTLLPDTATFLFMYVRREAVLSSQIEGTRSSLSDLLLFEIDETSGVPFDDAREVSCYVRALEHGMQRMKEGLPLSNRLLREIHGILLSEGRGSDKDPGEFRTSQNWVGGTRPGRADFVPPPPDEVARCMGDLELFLHDRPARTPPLLKAALAHVQFETVHPFLDGNGRVGRLLIPLLFCSTGVLREPLLYLSLYLKEHRQRYFELLQVVRSEGDWESWIDFFVEGVRETAAAAAGAADSLARLFERDRARIQGLGRSAGSVLRVHHALQQRPILTIARAVQMTGLTQPSVDKSMRHLVQLEIVRELTGRRRHRVFGYGAYLAILGEEQASG